MSPVRFVAHALASALVGLVAVSAAAQRSDLRAPNVVVISPELVTSGQPTAAALAGLAAQGFGAVINLAPPAAMDAVKDEALIVGRQGLVFVNIPITFENPTPQDFDTFAGVLRGLAGRKILVHCQINMRASSMVFLYRTIIAKEDPRVAYESVIKTWVPEGPWKRLIRDELRQHKINFEPF
jgi:protein tyrosine phosphatase (PTP) superfamily phosphohydrolase (DUF442 family)